MGKRELLFCAVLLLTFPFVILQLQRHNCGVTESYIYCKDAEGKFLPSVSRSNIHYIFISNCDMSSLTPEDFALFPEVTSIEIRVSKLSLPAQNGLFSKLRDLRDLRIEHCDVGGEVATTFADNYFLERLSLRSNRIASITRQMFKKLTRLQELDLSGNNASILEDGFLEDLEGIRILNLSGNALDGVSPGIVAITTSRCTVCRPKEMPSRCSYEEVRRCIAGRPFDQLWWRIAALTVHLEGNPLCDGLSSPLLKIQPSSELYFGVLDCEIHLDNCAQHENRNKFLMEACGVSYSKISNETQETQSDMDAGTSKYVFIGTWILGIIVGLLTFSVHILLKHVPARTSLRGSRGIVLADDRESKVLVIYTGGTIGMRKDGGGALAPASNTLVDFMSKNPTLHDKDYAQRKFGDRAHNSPTLVLPEVKGTESKRILYSVLEYSPLLDSSNMSVEHWEKIANDIRDEYENFKGFVVLHGTDTLVYTASALSFMLENLGKTVIITGSQIPLFEPLSDGQNNLLGAVILAGHYVVPEVCVFFNQQLFRGNRTTKVASSSLNAFDSPNYPTLATFGVDVNVNYHSDRQSGIKAFNVFSKLNRNVGMLCLFPTITANTIRAFLLPPIEGCVLQSYGAGNVPSDRHDILDALREATARGVIIVNTSQCIRGGVAAEMYATGTVLRDVGVLPGFDMSPATALTKLAYVLAKDNWNLDKKKRMMQKNLRGELTPVVCTSTS